MALSWLFSKTLAASPGISIAGKPTHGAHGIIVDHGLRQNSAYEASLVADELRKLSIEPRIRKLNMSKASPEQLTNVEGLARKMRFRKLGLACLSLHVSHLFFAHHSDDQYETILMRLMAGHCYRGLQGMAEAAPNTIPECYGLYGVHKSGLFLSPDKPPQCGRHSMEMSSLECEDGGVTIHRPLLQFDKDRLIATCEANHVPWFQDPTNFDPTLTPRNAIRHMVRNHQLPLALQKPAILAMSHKTRARASCEENQAQRWLVRHGVIRHFNSNGGTLLIALPPPQKCWNQRRRLFAQARLQKRRIIATIALRKLIDFVTPDVHLAALSNLSVAVDRLFPQLRRTPITEAKSFTIAGVCFFKKPNGTWLLTRSPFTSIEPTPEARFHLGRPREDRSLVSRPEKRRSSLVKMTAPVLWDGRFWIKLRPEKAVDLYVLPLQPQYLHDFRKCLPIGLRHWMDQKLKEYAPEKTRFTLPAIYQPVGRTCKEETEEELRLLALPTLGVHARAAEFQVTYEAKYKAVDRALLKASQEEAAKPAPRHAGRLSCSRRIRRGRLGTRKY